MTEKEVVLNFFPSFSSKLTSLQREVISRRHGLDDYPPESWEDIAQSVGKKIKVVDITYRKGVNRLRRLHLQETLHHSGVVIFSDTCVVS